MAETWFRNVNPVKLIVTQYHSISDETPQSQVTINDAEAISKIVKRIEHIPLNGDMMKKPGPKAEYSTLEFIGADKATVHIKVLNKRFQTPSTAFNTEDRGGVEASLYQDLDSLMNPKYGNLILRVRDLKFQFKDFSLTYDGVTNRPDPALTGGDTSGPTSNTLFTIAAPGKKAQRIDIFAGQAPPQPAEFVVKNQKFTLKIFGEGIPSLEYFKVIKM